MTTNGNIISPTPSPGFRAPSPFFRRNRILGRAPSPPTWACYEQIHSDDYYDGEFSCSDSDSGGEDNDDDDHRSCSEDGEDYDVAPVDGLGDQQGQGNDSAVVDSMDVDEVGDAEKKAQEHALAQAKSKGKQKAVDDEQEHGREEILVTRKVARPARRKGRDSYRRQPEANLRPILTIQKSQGFVWNQVWVHPLFHMPCARN